MFTRNYRGIKKFRHNLQDKIQHCPDWVKEFKREPRKTANEDKVEQFDLKNLELGRIPKFPQFINMPKLPPLPIKKNDDPDFIPESIHPQDFYFLYIAPSMKN